MKNSVRKTIRIIGLLALVIATTIIGIYFLKANTEASGSRYTSRTEKYIPETKETEATTEVATESETVPETEAPTVLATEAEIDKTVATENVEINVVDSEVVEETEPETTPVVDAITPVVIETKTPTEVTTVPVVIETEAPTVPAVVETEAPTAPVVVETKLVDVETTTFTDVVLKTVDGTFNYLTLDEAKANVKVPVLSDAEAKKIAISNKAAYSSQVKELVDMINSYRKASGLGVVTYNDNLTNAAMHRAAESAYSNWNMTAKENGTKRHIRPNFKKASSIGEEYGITGSFGENYGRYQKDTTEILEGWQASNAHNALLLNDKYNQIGIGIAADSEGYLYWIAIFN